MLRVICCLLFALTCACSAPSLHAGRMLAAAHPEAALADEEPAATADADDGLFHFDLLLYLPNRFLDLIDMLRVDVGVLFGTGIKARVGNVAQVGLRSVGGFPLPFMVRVGLFGRRVPLLLESESEWFVGFLGNVSDDRIPTWGEVGAGVDVFIVGAYAAVCVDEVLDFVGGLFFLDYKHDDWGRD